MGKCMACERERAGYDFLTRTLDALQDALELAANDDVSSQCAAELREGISKLLRDGEHRTGEWSAEPWSREETVSKTVFLESVVRDMREALQDAAANQGVCEVCTGDIRGTIMRMLVYDERRTGPYSRVRD